MPNGDFKMKTLNIYIGLAVILASMGISNVCLAVVINDTNAGLLDGTNVGFIDTFIAEGDQQGNPTNETVWVNSILSPTNVTYVVKNEPVTYYKTDETGVFGFELEKSPDYYLIKNSTYVALFQNLANIDWGVFDVGDLTDNMKLPDTSKYTISHVTEFDDTNGGVPAPAILGVMAIGLLGVSFGTRRKLT